MFISLSVNFKSVGYVLTSLQRIVQCTYDRMYRIHKTAHHHLTYCCIHGSTRTTLYLLHFYLYYERFDSEFNHYVKIASFNLQSGQLSRWKEILQFSSSHCILNICEEFDDITNCWQCPPSSLSISWTKPLRVENIPVTVFLFFFTFSCRVKFITSWRPTSQTVTKIF